MYYLGASYEYVVNKDHGQGEDVDYESKKGLAHMHMHATLMTC